MQVSKRFIDFIISFLLFVLSSVLYFLKLLYKSIREHGKFLLICLDNCLCTTKNSIIFLGCYSFLLNYFLEAALRRSFTEPLLLLIKSPHVYLLGALIVYATLSLMYLFKRRAFYFSVVSMAWIIITYVSFFLMCQRTTPFNSSDFRVLKSAIDIIPVYLSIIEMILLSLAIVLMVFLLWQIFRKCKKAKGILSKAVFAPIIICGVTIACVVCNTVFVIKADRFDNLPNKYREHGFVFCFLYSIIDNGIPKPDNYSKNAFHEQREKVVLDTVITQMPEIEHTTDASEELLDSVYSNVIDSYAEMPNYGYLDFTFEQSESITSSLEEKYNALKERTSAQGEDGTHASTCNFPDSFERPNVLFLQLESFYDVNNIMGYQYSDEPHPIYSLLKENLPGGKLTVPSIGAGTANTEFEIITGMDVSFFGIAEYPYLSVLQTQTCESMANNAREYGYTSHAIHNHKGTFYDRHIVFPNLGFDTFTSIENTPVVIRNRRNWAKDAMLIDPILAALDSSEQQDLVYTISVQPHGRYPSQSKYDNLLDGEEPRIKVYGNDDNPENPGFTYYVNELKEVDTFLGNLILELSFRNEPTVLVFYGDHLPAFSVQKNWDLKDGNCYQTDYIIWNNCGIDFSDAKDLTTYQLNSYIFSKLGINNGDFNRLNRLYLENNVDDYSHLRHIYQYATLYDSSLKDDSTVSVPKYPRIDTKYGVTQTSLLSAYTIDGATYVTGEYFNEFTKVSVNSKPVDTEFINPNLLVTYKEFEQDDIIGTVQQAANHTILGESENTLTYTNLMIVPEELKQQYLDSLVPSSDDFTNPSSNVKDDATAEFITGEEEGEMLMEGLLVQMPSDSGFSSPAIAS